MGESLICRGVREWGSQEISGKRIGRVVASLSATLGETWPLEEPNPFLFQSFCCIFHFPCTFIIQRLFPPWIQLKQFNTQVFSSSFLLYDYQVSYNWYQSLRSWGPCARNHAICCKGIRVGVGEKHEKD